MGGITEIDFVRVDADPFGAQASGQIAAQGREHGEGRRESDEAAATGGAGCPGHEPTVLEGPAGADTQVP